MKKIIALCIVLALCISLAGCGQKPATETNNQQGSSDSGKVVLKVGSTTAPDGHYVKGLEVFKQKVEEYTNGKVEVKIFPSSQLGNERDLIEGVASGTVEMCITSTGPLPNFSADFTVLDLPYVMPDREKAYSVLDGDIGQAILKTLEPKGIKALGFWENGFRNISNNIRPIVHPEDLKGLKIRTMENPVHIATFKGYGAIPTPMAWGEVFTALQQGTIDGQENPLVIIYTDKIYEAQKYISLTGHFYSPAVLMINKDLFDSFPQDIQEAIIKAEKEARTWERNYSSQLDDQLVQALTEKGVNITKVDLEEWKKASQGVYDQFKDKIKPEYMAVLTEK